MRYHDLLQLGACLGRLFVSWPPAVPRICRRRLGIVQTHLAETLHSGMYLP